MSRLAALLLALALFVTVMPSAVALPTPGFNGPAARDVTGRIFPEALQTNDFVSYDEARAGLDILVSEHPELIQVVTLGKSAGWNNTIEGGRDQFDVFAVIVTNAQSPIPLDDRLHHLFMLSIHGNEKGAREGGLRVIEDFAKAAEGAADHGMATPERFAMLDYMRLIFLFPNPDGWIHEELEYRANNPGYFNLGTPVETQNFVRTNGNGVDLNRQTPTQGWSRAETSRSHMTLREPEPRGYVPWLQNDFARIDFASDIHGMLYPADALINSSRPVACVPAQTPAGLPGIPFLGGLDGMCLREGHFLLTLLPAGRFDPVEEVQITGMAELLEERINANPFFAEYTNLPELGVWGGSFNSWGTVWDTIGYVDSGFSGDYFAQDIGLDAPGMDFELSYNHVTFDNYYPGLTARINDYHVEITREIVAVFMDYANAGLKVSIDTKGTRTAYVETSIVATSLDDTEPLTGWAAENPADDAWDYAHNPFTATINEYFADLKPFLIDAGAPGVLDKFRAQDLVSTGLGSYDTVVIPGSAARYVRATAGATEALATFVQGGGRLVLTDEALGLFEDIGALGDGSVAEGRVYAGYANFVARDDPLATGVRGLARQLVEPMPLGFEEGNNLPVWTIDRAALEGAGGVAVGVTGEARVVIGHMPFGAGSVVGVGALLPDPTEDYYHPYGLAPYATTYTANQVFRNALGWELRFETPPRIIEAGSIRQSAAPSSSPATSGEESSGVPAPGVVALLVLGAAAALVAHRRR